MGLFRGTPKTWIALLIVAYVAILTVSAEHMGHMGMMDELKKKLHDKHLDNLYDKDHGVKMGVPSFCDDGKTQIEVDWNPKSTSEMHCSIVENIQLNMYADPIYITEISHGPSMHICFPDKVEYETDLPLSGSHRPLWPVFGEYKYLPPPRWVHSLEHGAIVFLYHPCVKDDAENVTNILKDVMRGCLWKHVISPYKKIPHHMPYAILAFGEAILFGHKDGSKAQTEALKGMIKAFIKQYAFKASESHVLENGGYSAGIKVPALPKDESPNRILCDV